MVAKNLLDHMKLVTTGEDDCVGFIIKDMSGARGQEPAMPHVSPQHDHGELLTPLEGELFLWDPIFQLPFLIVIPFQEAHMRPRKPCPHCGKVFRSSNLLRHMRQVHNSAEWNV